MQVTIKPLSADVPCDQTVRAWRWPDGIECPAWQSTQVIKRGVDDTEPARQRYECTDGHPRVDELTDTILAGHHQPRKVWRVCLYCRGRHVSNAPMAHTLAVHSRDRQQMTAQLRAGMVNNAHGTPVTRGGVRRSLGACRPSRAA